MPNFAGKGGVTLQAALVEALRRKNNYNPASTDPNADPPEGLDLVNELVAGFTPGVGTAQALRDYKKAAAAGDIPGMVMNGLGTLPVVGGVAKAGLLIPIIAGRNKLSAKVDTDLARRAMAAYNMQKAGKDEEAIWKALQVSPVQRTTSTTHGPYQGSWAHEVNVPPGEDLFSPYASMAENDKIDLIVPWAAKQGIDLSPAQLETMRRHSAPLPVKSTVGEELNFGDLFQQYPELGNIKFNAFQNLDAKPTSKGFYNTATGVHINPGAMLHSGGARSNAIHELGHGVQDMFYAPRGGMPIRVPLDEMQRDELMKLGTALRNDPNVDLARLGVAIKHNAQRSPHDNYLNYMGEADARNMAYRDTLTQAQRDSQSPTATLEEVVLNTKALIDADAWEAARSVTRPSTRAWPGYDQTRQMEDLVAILRGKRVLP